MAHVHDCRLNVPVSCRSLKRRKVTNELEIVPPTLLYCLKLLAEEESCQETFKRGKYSKELIIYFLAEGQPRIYQAKTLLFLNVDPNELKKTLCTQFAQKCLVLSMPLELSD